MPGCSLYTNLDFTLGFPTIKSTIDIKFPVPLQTRLLNQVFFNQCIVVDQGANATGLTVSKALRLEIGKD